MWLSGYTSGWGNYTHESNLCDCLTVPVDGVHVTIYTHGSLCVCLAVPVRGGGTTLIPEL